jgi:WD40 repeat protein
MQPGLQMSLHLQSHRVLLIFTSQHFHLCQKIHPLDSIIHKQFPNTLSLTCGRAVNWPNIIHVFEGHTSSVWSVAFSPDGKQIVSGSSDNSIRVWDAVSGDVVVGPLKGHTSSVLSVAFSPDGKQIVSGSLTTPFECGML